MVAIKGLQKTSLVDFPSYVSCTIFISGCNFRCGFCYNVDLVNDSDKLKEISEDEILSFLDKRKNVLDGVCITGGEPTLYKNLYEFIKKIKGKGFKVKLDTNGTNPKLLKKIMDAELVDYVAMDIKSSLEKYDKAANVKVDKYRIKESIKAIIGGDVDYEFRMTAVPTLVEKEDFEEIGKMLKGAQKFYIQKFQNKSCLDEGFEHVMSFSSEELNEFRKILKKYIDKVGIRE